MKKILMQTGSLMFAASFFLGLNPPGVSAALVRLPPASQNNAESASSPLDNADQESLLKLARNSVESYVRTGQVPKVENPSPGIRQKLGAFVTLKKAGELRGCIGRFQPDIPLYEVVIQMAVAAATQDTRFQPVGKGELGSIDYEISVLSPLRKVKSADEIEIGKHGVEVVNGFHGGVFLPQVATENNWNKETFLSVLCTQKAGLPPNCWQDPSTQLFVFTAQVFGEKKQG